MDGPDLPGALHVPDGAPAPRALARTTDLVVGAHPDDAELLAPGVLAAAADDPHRWATVIVCTDGAGSVAPPGEPDLTGAALAERRAAEQRAAADLGRYGAAVLLDHPSRDLRTPAGAADLRAELAELVARCRPATVLTHNPADRHPTHVAVVAAVVDAVRSLPADERPTRLLGCEAWRDLDWLPDADKARLDVTGHEAVAADLLAAFGSQLGAKRYDRAAAGRRRANATFGDPHRADDATEVVVAMDLTPLVVDDDLDPVAWVTGHIDRFRAEVVDGLRAAWGPAADGDA